MATHQAPHPPEGWYPDPEALGAERYWTGAAWSDERRPAGAALTQGKTWRDVARAAREAASPYVEKAAAEAKKKLREERTPPKVSAPPRVSTPQSATTSLWSQPDVSERSQPSSTMAARTTSLTNDLRLGKRDDYAGRVYRMIRGWAWVIASVVAVILLLQIPNAWHPGEKAAYAGTAGFVLLIAALVTWFAGRACRTVSPDMSEAQQKKAVRDRLLFNPVTFVIGVIAFPLWPFLAAALFVWFFAKWAKHWGKGGRWADDGLIAKNKMCPRCQIEYSGTCPKCGSLPSSPPPDEAVAARPWIQEDLATFERLANATPRDYRLSFYGNFTAHLSLVGPAANFAAGAAHIGYSVRHTEEGENAEQPVVPEVVELLHAIRADRAPDDLTLVQHAAWSFAMSENFGSRRLDAMQLPGRLRAERTIWRDVSLKLLTNPGAQFQRRPSGITEEVVRRAWDYGYALRCVEGALAVLIERGAVT
jgi:hypothetical protein